MQAPQITGIFIGLCLIVAGWFLRRFFVLKEKRIAGGIAFTIFAYVGVLSILQNVIFSYAASWSWEGVSYAWMELFGKFLIPIALAFVGFFYKPNKVAGYAVALLVFTVLVVYPNA